MQKTKEMSALNYVQCKIAEADADQHSSQPNMIYFMKLGLTGRNTEIPSEVVRYADLLRLVNFDEAYSMFRFRCDRWLFDRFKTKNDNNNAFDVRQSDYERLMVDATFPKLISEDDAKLILTDPTLRPGDLLTKSKKIGYLSDLMYDLLKDIVKIDASNRRMYYKSNDSLEFIDRYSHESFARFLRFPVETVISFEDVVKSVELLTKRLTADFADKRNNIIQFDDCKIVEGIVQPGFCEGFPRFSIKRKVWKAVSTGKPTRVVQAVDDLLLHLCNYDIPTMNRLKDIMCLPFLNSKKFKTIYNFSPRIVGIDGENGKSTFHDLLNRAFNVGSSTNCTTFSLQKLDERDTTYKVLNSLVSIDGDSSSRMISEDAASLFKSITSGDAVGTRALFKEAENIEAMCLLIEFSNDFPRSSDKSSAYLRRLELIRCDYQLKNGPAYSIGPNSKPAKINLTQEWFDEINSEEAAQYLIEMLLIRAQEIARTRKIYPKSDHMIQLVKEYAYSNNSALSFFDSVGPERIVGYGIKEIKRLYSEWCDEHDAVEMKQKFVETLQSKGLVKKSVTVDFVNQSAEVYTSFSAGKTSASIWQYADKEQNNRYFAELRAESKIESSEEKNLRLVTEFLDSIGGVRNLLNSRVSSVKDRFNQFCESNNFSVKDKDFNSILTDQFRLIKKNLRSDHVIPIDDFDVLDKDADVHRCWVKENE